MAFVIFVVLLALFFYIHQLSERISSVERRLDEAAPDVSKTATTPASTTETAGAHPSPTADTTSKPSPLPPPDATPPFQPRPVTAAQQTVPSPSPSQPAPETEFFLYSWFKDEPLIKIGGLLFFLGAVWFVGYAVNQAWLPPEMQIWLAYLAAAGIYGVGWLRAQIVQTHYIVLTCLGTGIVFAATIAAQFIYELFSPAVALVILTVSIVYTVSVSLRSQTEWLSVAAVVAGLSAPLLVNSPTNDHALLLSYLLVLTAGFLSVVWFTTWRLVTLVLLLGISFYLSGLLSVASPLLLWSFTILFCVLLFASVTATVLRSRDAHTLDIVHVSITGLLFMLLADELAIKPGVAILLAAVFVAGVTSYAYLMHYSARVIALFGATTVALAFVATGQLLSGDALVVTYTLEIATAFFLLNYLNVSKRMQVIAASLYALPLLLSFEALFSSAWEVGVPATAALSTVTVAAAFWVTSLWLFERERVSSSSLSTNLTVTFAIVSYLYTVVLLERFAVALTSALRSNVEPVLTYVLWSALALVLVNYILQRTTTTAWVRGSLCTLVLPVLASFGSFTLQRWDGVWHTDALGVYAVLSVMTAVSLLLWLRYRANDDAALRPTAIGIGVLTIGYAYVLLYSFWHGVFGPGDRSFAALYISYALLGYGLFALSAVWKLSWSWLRKVLLFLVPPAILALVALFASSAWETVWHPHLVGLFVVVATLLLAGVRVQVLRTSAATSQQSLGMRNWQRFLYGVAFVLGVGMVWRVTHAVVPSRELAVVVTLFIYTVTGLICYSVGRAREHATLKLAGILLLSLVVARLLLVDVWSMETLPRILTFLGIGFLFIVTALVEKPFAQRPKDKVIGSDTKN